MKQRPPADRERLNLDTTGLPLTLLLQCFSVSYSHYNFGIWLAFILDVKRKQVGGCFGTGDRVLYSDRVSQASEVDPAGPTWQGSWISGWDTEDGLKMLIFSIPAPALWPTKCQHFDTHELSRSGVTKIGDKEIVNHSPCANNLW